MNSQRKYDGVIWNAIIWTKMRRVCVIILTSNTIPSEDNNDGYN